MCFFFSSNGHIKFNKESPLWIFVGYQKYLYNKKRDCRRSTRRHSLLLLHFENLETTVRKNLYDKLSDCLMKRLKVSTARCEKHTVIKRLVRKVEETSGRDRRSDSPGCKNTLKLQIHKTSGRDEECGLKQEVMTHNSFVAQRF